MEDTEIFYINKEIFLTAIEKEDLRIMKAALVPMDVEKIARYILSIKANTKFKVTI